MGLKDAKERKKSKEREKKKKKDKDDVAMAAMLGIVPGAIEGALLGAAGEDKELWMMGDKTYETTAKERKKMERTEDEAMADGGKVMRYYNEGGGVYGYNHGGGVNKHQGQYDIQVKKIKGKGKVL
jgi:hypothetical protein|tara:strand:+ start:168 stop:545 length:378 start_codon:yes stop_codon:yes gene_type:complete